MAVNRKFRKDTENNINVSLTDFLTGRGYLTMFGGKTADRYLLSSIAFSTQTIGFE